MPAIELVTKDNKVRFFVNAPIFFHDGRIYQVQNYLLNEHFFKTLQIEHNKGKLFAIKTLYTSPLLSSGSKQYVIRGCFILNCDKLISDERDTKLEKLIDANI